MTIAEAVAVLRRGGLVAFPTETVYGLGADASSPSAVTRVFEVKGRPLSHPLIVHLGSAAQLPTWAASVPPAARALADAYWPGPLTLLLTRTPSVLDQVTGGRPTVAVRVPGHPVALELLGAFGGGLVGPSANRFGRVSPTTAAHVAADLGDTVDLILDGGPTTIGVESTIVDCTTDPPAILRHGGISAEQVAAAVGGPVTVDAVGPSRAPGMLESHYAPGATVELASSSEAAAARLAALAAAGRRADVLDPDVSSDEYARRLYGWLREADARRLDVLVVVPPADTGIGRAVNERLRKAAGSRS